MVELLAPAGGVDKLNTALYFGADAVYLGGKNYGLRAYSSNFDNENMQKAVELVHNVGKKIYVTANIFAKNSDIEPMKEYINLLYQMGVDAVLMTDPGAIMVAREAVPNLEIHLSTQSNTTNLQTVKFWAKQGIKRVVLARELSIDEIAEIKQAVGGEVELEVFVHGAMCISYSGRCLLSNYLNGRDSNRGECVQACRWEYEINEVNKKNKIITVQEDKRGTYFLNSRDLNMIAHLDKLIKAGVSSLKIEGRMKSQYYVASVVNAYRRALDTCFDKNGNYMLTEELREELNKTSHREYTTAYYLGANSETECQDYSMPMQDFDFIAEVVSDVDANGYVEIEQRNRFLKTENLEILSPFDTFNSKIQILDLKNMEGLVVEDAKLVQEHLMLKADKTLHKGDMLRKEKK